MQSNPAIYSLVRPNMAWLLYHNFHLLSVILTVLFPFCHRNMSSL